jgi:transcription elongation factor GreA
MENEHVRNKRVNLMTKFTHDSLLIEVQRARKNVSDSLLMIGEAAGSESNWHDNSAFDAANVQHDVNSSKLAGIEAKLENVEIITPSPKTDTVTIGNLVVVRFQGEVEDETFAILGPADSGRKPGWISFESPLGSNLIGKKEGEEVSFLTSDQKQKVRIIKILPGDF